MNKQVVSRKELTKLLGGRGAHLVKLAMDYERVSKIVYGKGSKGFDNMKEFAAKYNLPVHKTDYETAMKLHEMTYSLVTRFHDIKMAFLYVDYFRKRWRDQRAFNDYQLKNMCQYLQGHVLRPYLAIKSSLVLLSIGVSFGSSEMTKEQAKEWLENPFVVQLRKLYDRYDTAEWHNVRIQGRAALSSVDIKTPLDID